MIAWAEFSWEAFATLTTGVLAVVAAAIVGLRQLGLVRRQTELSELSLRAELFEKRFAVYDATRKFLTAIMREANKADADSERGFLSAMDQSKFLFRPEVYDDLRELWKKYCDYGANKSIMESNYRRRGEYGTTQVETEYELTVWFNEKLNNLADIFGTELKLSPK